MQQQGSQQVFITIGCDLYGQLWGEPVDSLQALLEPAKQQQLWMLEALADTFDHA